MHIDPYERGYIDSWTHVGFASDSEREAYYDSLSEEDRVRYDAGWKDGYGGLPRREGRHPEPVKAIKVLHEILHTQGLHLSKGGQVRLETEVEPFLEMEDPSCAAFALDRFTNIHMWTPRLVKRPEFDQEHLFDLATHFKQEYPLALFYLWNGTKWMQVSREVFFLYLYYEMKL